ncbi:hypothetical protein ASPZODRAFT_64052 [Penicilliopsis zonata CBS 506.65]|uniref:Enoyl reductase (ER) domain-containing protein n=1 Tax=Penicilliopsis zonata CBS 506.65 TaxID=1073090 RepID=A0A1L9SKA0_9EURO|nr:hypothetical protein ASPZODRAFT_64052 [Penicilliopsis zonata CBS 506.65]OJJ47521.1 hypothetical protein ASPZODRAFT_64052 [Penicilliopsis zonata CBS 506.65]
MKPAKPESTTMDKETFVPPTMRALYFSPPPASEETKSTTATIAFDADFPTPQPSFNQYLVKVQAASFSLDELQAARTLNPTLSIPQIPVHSFCGTVISTPVEDHQNPFGPRFKIGDSVIGLKNYTLDGAAADYVLTTEDELAFKPRNVTAKEAASIPLPALTAWHALFAYARLMDTLIGGTQTKSGLRVLVTSAYDSDAAIDVIRILRAPRHLLNPGIAADDETPVWICAVCSSTDQELFLTDQLGVDKVMVSGSNLEDSFRAHGWEPVDLVVDASGAGETFRQSHSPHVVKDDGMVLSTVSSSVDAVRNDPRIQEQVAKGKLGSHFVAVRPDGLALQRIVALVETNALRGRVDRVMDMVDAGLRDILGGRRETGKQCKGKMTVIHVDTSD